MNVTFDWNEWFFILTSSFSLLGFIIIRKYFPSIMVLIIWIYNISTVATIDYFLIATPFQTYIFGDNATYELSGALFHLITYPCASLIFLYIYDKWELYGKKAVWYILVWTIIALFIEWVSVKNHALTYTSWKLSYSIPFYPGFSILLILFFNFTKKKLQELSLQRREN